MATGYDDDVEMRATWAQLNGNNRGKGSSLSNFMLQRLMLGNRTPARSNKEGIGRFLAPLLVGLATQGIQSWKDNYDQRGVNKQRADVLNERISRGETLSAEDQAFYDQMKKNYPDRYNATAGTFNGQNGAQPPATPAPQDGAQPAAPQIGRETAWAAAQTMQPPAQAQAPELAGASQQYTGQQLSDVATQNLQDALQNMGRDQALEELLNQSKTKDDFLKDISRRFGW